MADWKNKFNWNKIKEDIEKERSKKKGYDDPRFWVPDWKEAVAKSVFFTFRFLPDQEGTPFVKYYHHAFKYEKDNGVKWYINNCISTFGWDPKCPICAKNSEYYDSAFESDKNIAKERGRKVNFVSNVLIINDPIHPENNGRVALYKYGVKIYEMIEKRLFPTPAELADEDYIQFIPFDLMEGADFKLKIEMQGEFPNYSTSEWTRPKPVMKGESEKIDEIMEKTVLLSEFVDPKKYPTIEETVSQVGHLLGVSLQSAPVAAPTKPQMPEPADDNPFLTSAVAAATPAVETVSEPEVQASDAGNDIDADRDFFSKL